MAIVATGEMALNVDEKGFESSISKLAKKAAVAFGGVFAAQKVFQFGGDVIKEASDLGESINAINVAFGKSAEGVLALGQNAAKSLGLSRNEFNALAVRFSAFADTIAGPGGNATKIIDNLTKRGADFASVFNIQVDEALQVFQSGLAGETEPLRKFGIDLSAAAVEAFAFANGIAKQGSTLTEAQKVQARYGLLLQQTSKVQGDFANTSDSLANRQRILGARFDDLKAKIGAGILPVISGLAGTALNTVIPALERLGGVVGDTLGPIFDKIGIGFRALIGAFQEGDVTSNGFVGGMERVGNILRTVLEDLIKPLGAFLTDTLKPAFAAVVDSADEVGEALLDVTEFLTRNIDTIKKVAAVIGTLLIPHFIKLGVEATISAAKQVAAWVSTKAQAIAATFVSSAQFAIQIARWVALGVAATANAAVIAAAWLVSLGPIALVVAAVVGLAAVVIKNWDTIKNAITTAVRFVLDFIQNNWPLILAIITGPIGLAVKFIVDNWDKIREVFASGVQWIKDRFGDLIGFVGGLNEKIARAAKGMWDGILNAFKSVINSVIRLWNRFVSHLKIPSVGVGPFKTPSVDIGSRLQIPELHSGGVFQAPFGRSEGLALLQSGETVFPRGALPISVSVVVNGNVTEDQAYAAGQAAGRGIRDEMARTALRRAVRAQ